MNRTYTYLTSFALSLIFPITHLHAQCGVSMVHTTDGDTAVYTCPGDQVADAIMLENTAPASDMFAYIITDDQNMILDVPGDVPMIDVEAAGPGICRVWGLTYTGTLTAAMGDDLMDTDLATGCTELSANFISLYRDMPEAGSISLQDGGNSTTIVTGDGVPDVVYFATTSTSISNYAWIITDEESMILGVEHVPMHDFEPAGPGTCLVYGVSYTGELMAPMGADVNMIELSDDCFDLSSTVITVVRLSVGILESPAITQLRTYPTVVSDLLTIEFPGLTTEGNTILINDIQGSMVKEISAPASSERLVLDLSDLPSGSYLCTVMTNEGRAVGRFIRE